MNKKQELQLEILKMKRDEIEQNLEKLETKMKNLQKNYSELRSKKEKLDQQIRTFGQKPEKRVENPKPPQELPQSGLDYSVSALDDFLNSIPKI